MGLGDVRKDSGVPEGRRRLGDREQGPMGSWVRVGSGPGDSGWGVVGIAGGGFCVQGVGPYPQEPLVDVVAAERRETQRVVVLERRRRDGEVPGPMRGQGVRWGEGPGRRRRGRGR